MSVEQDRAVRAPAEVAALAVLGSALMLATCVWFFVQRAHMTAFLEHGHTGATWTSHFAATRRLVTTTAFVLVAAAGLGLRRRTGRHLYVVLLIATAVLAVVALQVSPAHFGGLDLIVNMPRRYGDAAFICLVASLGAAVAAVLSIRGWPRGCPQRHSSGA